MLDEYIKWLQEQTNEFGNINMTPAKFMVAMTKAKFDIMKVIK